MPRHSLSILVLSLAALSLALPAGAQDANSADAVPDQALQEMDQIFQLPRRPQSREEYIRMISTQMGKALERGAQLEARYPDANNLHDVRLRMLMAADFLVRSGQGQEPARKRQAIAQRLVDSNAPPTAEVTADFFVTAAKVKPAQDKTAPDAAKQIRAFLARYKGTDAQTTALVRGAQLAEISDQDALRKELLDNMAAHDDEPAINAFLREAGRNPTFHAELPMLDGSTLEMPAQTKGKVIVLDFWATWCPPCVASLPHMKELYAKYQGKPVEFIGISLDRPNQKAQVQQFIRKRELNWKQAYSGKYWKDPTARRYGIRAIPAVWVIGKDGKILSTEARGNEDRLIQQALAAPAPKAQQN